MGLWHQGEKAGQVHSMTARQVHQIVEAGEGASLGKQTELLTSGGWLQWIAYTVKCPTVMAALPVPGVDGRHVHVR